MMGDILPVFASQKKTRRGFSLAANIRIETPMHFARLKKTFHRDNRAKNPSGIAAPEDTEKKEN
jgi:hypothetical protein